MLKNLQRHNAHEQKESVRAYFDSIAPTYEDDPWYRAQGETVQKFVSAATNGAVLDVGCGTGWLLRHILKDRPGWTGTGLDLSSAMVDMARSKAEGVPGLEFLEGDWEKAVFNKGDFSSALCVSTFHYFADPMAAARKIHRALAPGGQLLLLERELEGAFLNRIWDIAHRWVIKDHCRFYHSHYLIQLLTEVNFTDVKIVSQIKKYFWKGRVQTNLVLLSATA